MLGGRPASQAHAAKKALVENALGCGRTRGGALRYGWRARVSGIYTALTLGNRSLGQENRNQKGNMRHTGKLSGQLLGTWCSYAALVVLS